MLRRRPLRRHADDRGGVDLGFDHVAIAAGAGRPTIIAMKNNLIRGIRKASDFLMALQLTGAFKQEALANLQVELPAVVIGGGLTAIDTATELLAYYPLRSRRRSRRYETLGRRARARRPLRAIFDEEEREILDRFLAHGTAVRSERESRRGSRRAARLRPPRAGSGAASRSPTANAGGFARLSPEPRRDHQGARGGDRVHREPGARGGGPRRARRR